MNRLMFIEVSKFKMKLFKKIKLEILLGMIYEIVVFWFSDVRDKVIGWVVKELS